MCMRFRRKVAFSFILALGIAFPVETPADIYRYVDENGVVHFTNTPTDNRFSFYRKEIGPSTGGQVADLSEIISRYASLFNLEEALLRAVIRAESNYNTQAVSSKGAMGVMQLIPETARYLDVNDPFNPEENIRGGSRYLRMMLDEFNGDLDLALAAYNAGPNAVKRHGGVPPFRETKTYIERVKGFLLNYRKGSGSRL
jgi:soluble lytic murein transglycosylase-like protein